MANIDGGALSFKSVLDNDQLDSAIDESLRRIQGLSDGTVAGGKAMDAAFYATADSVRKALGNIGTAIGTHEQELQRLESEYIDLGVKASKAFSAGRDDEYRAINQQQNAVKGEITVRQKLIRELQEQSNKLEDTALKMEENRRKMEENAKAQASMRTRIRDLREEMMLLIDQGIDEQSEAYKRLEAELGRLTDIQGDVNQQARILANDEAHFQGIIQGLSGLSGGFSVATGAVSLFAGESENLQKIMVKVQSLMAITIGLQQVAQTVNKDSAFQLVTLNGLKEWWASIVAKATVNENANTVATVANTAAQTAQTTATATNTAAQSANTVATGAQTAAATAGTVANIGLAGAFRLVGAAIKSIPVFGWILAGISAIIGLVSLFSNRAREARRAQEEFNRDVVEGAYKSIGAIEHLSAKWNRLGDDLDAKRRFVEENKKAFEELGAAVRDVADAETLLNAGKQSFIDAQIAKAKASIYLQQTTEKIKRQMELEAEIAEMSDIITRSVTTMYGASYSYETENQAKIKKQKELEELRVEIQQGYENVHTEEAKALKKMEELGVESANTYRDRTVGAIEQAVSKKQEALNKDLFLKELEKRKKEYQRFMAWVNSGDEILAESAHREFEGLLREGATYIDYLKAQRDQILNIDTSERTKEQSKQLRTLNDAIAEETHRSVLDAFNDELQEQLNSAQTVLDKLNVIALKRRELAQDGTEIDLEKRQALDGAERDALRQQQEDTQKLLEDHAGYLDRRIKLDLEYSNDLALLEKARVKATTDAERNSIDVAIANRKRKYEKDSKLSGDPEYDQMLQTYRTFEQKRIDIIEEYNEKRLKAQEHGNVEMLAVIDRARDEALSKLALEEMQNSPDWERMFGNLDEIGTRELERLVATIEGSTATLGIELSAKDFEVIQDKVKELKREIRERNPFKALKQGFEDFKRAASNDDKMAAMAGMFDSAGKAGNRLKGVVSDIATTLDALGVEGTDEIGYAMQALEGLATGAMDAVTGFVSGNPAQMIGGAIKGIGSVVSYFAGANDRRAERSIKKHQENVRNLTSSYKELERQISKALSGNLYKHQQASIENMKQQQRELQGMIRAEQSKKRRDDEKIAAWQEQIKELDRSIEDTIDEMKSNLLATDVKSIASQLGDAIVGAFENGKDAAVAWGDTVTNIVNNLVKNMLIQKVLQEPIDKIISKYTAKWVDKSGVFKGFDVVIGDIDRLSYELGELYPSLEQSISVLTEKLNLSSAGNDTSLTGAIKGVTEETASIVAGQLNAMRINQGEANSVLRQQLANLSVIAQNTSYNRYLAEIHKVLKAMTAESSPLRSKGLV